MSRQMHNKACKVKMQALSSRCCKFASVHPQQTRCSALQIPDERAEKVVAKQQVIRFSDAEFVIDDNPELKSTLKHRAIVISSTCAIAALSAHGWAACSSLPVAAWTLFLGYIFADVGSGIYHWSVDNYGSGSTPVVGNQIAAFQGHHQRPWTITQREFCNNVSLTFGPGGAAAVVILGAALLGWTSAAFEMWAAASIFFICMSQQFHAWSHMKKSELPAAVVLLQDANIIVSRRMHGAHHKAPFNCNYCIVSGWCNPLLDAGLMLALERLVHSTLGVEPRCWSDPLEDWREQIPPEAM